MDNITLNIKLEGDDCDIFSSLRGSREFWGMDDNLIVARIIHNYLQDRKEGIKPLSINTNDIIAKLQEKAIQGALIREERERTRARAAGFDIHGAVDEEEEADE